MSETQKSPVVTPQSLVSENLIRAALRVDKGNLAELLSYEVKDFTKKGDNYTSVVTSACVRYKLGDEEGEVSYVAKCNPCRGLDAYERMNATFFEKEAHFFSEIMPLINSELQAAGKEPIRMPDCYATHLVPNEEVILLKDLRPEGFKMLDRKKCMDKDQAMLVLRELGRLHAASIIAQSKMSQPMEDKYTFLKRDFLITSDDCGVPKETDEIFRGIFKSNMETGATMAERIGGYDKVVGWLREHASQSGDMFLEMLNKKAPFDVLCHGDCWNNNILFRYDETGKPTDVRLLDLQNCRKASPATDLHYFLYTCFTGLQRRNNLQEFLKTYYDSLTEVFAGVSKKTPFTLEEMKKEYHSKNAFGLLMCLMVIPEDLADVMTFDEMTGKTEEEVRKFNESMLDQLDTNPLIRPRLLAVFEEMVEYGVISVNKED